MGQKEFNPADWLDQTTQQAPATGPAPHNSGARTGIGTTDIETIIQSIEKAQKDITHTYENWRNIGFALADGFGAAGRDYYHRVSCFYPGYSKTACDQQYDQCLKGKGHGITIKSFFYYAQQAGIDTRQPGTSEGPEDYEGSPESRVTAPEKAALPTLPKHLYKQLPKFLQQVVQPAINNEERDLLLLGSLVALSACLPSFYGIYDGKKVFANLFLFVTARASAGKGRLVHCKQLVRPIHLHLREQARLLRKEYDVQLLEFNQRDKGEKGDKPGKPAEKMLIIPANNSTTGVFQLLHENEGRGMIFETEGDTLAQAFKSDYGNYSDGFRKAFHHETISYYRRTDREYVDIESPCISTILSGTPKQVSTLIPNAENGLFSRFIFYYMNVDILWKNVFSYTSDNSLDAYYNQLGKDFFELYKNLGQQEEGVEFCLTEQQQEQFNQFFEQVQGTYVSLKGLDYLATVRRLGLIAFRISMILSALRIMEHGSLPTQIHCDDQDLHTTLDMVKILVKHAAKVFSELPEEEPMPKRKNKKERFFESLPKAFSRQKYLDIAMRLAISDTSAQKYISDFCKNGLLLRDARDQYLKPEIEEVCDF